MEPGHSQSSGCGATLAALVAGAGALALFSLPFAALALPFFSAVSFLLGSRRACLLLFVLTALVLPAALFSLLYSGPPPWPRTARSNPAAFRVKSFPPGARLRLAGADVELDSFGRRPVPGAPPVSDRNVLFLGCSYTFGHGVTAAEAFPSVAQRRLGEGFRVINGALPATGPNTLYAQLLFPELNLPGLPRRIDAIVYTMLPDHFDRSAGRGLWPWIDGPRVAPELELREGAPGIVGAFGERFWPGFWRERLGPGAYGKALEWVSRMQEAAERPLALSYEEKDFRLQSAIFRESARLAQDRFGARFVLHLWRLRDDFLPVLEAAGFIRELEAAGVTVWVSSPERLPADASETRNYHPGPDRHRQLGEELAERLKALH